MWKWGRMDYYDKQLTINVINISVFLILLSLPFYKSNDPEHESLEFSEILKNWVNSVDLQQDCQHYY